MTTEATGITLMLSVSGGGDAFGPFFAAVSLDRAAIEQLLRRANVHKVAHKMESELYQTTYFDYTPEFFESGHSTDPDDSISPEDAKKVVSIFGDDLDDADDLLCAECGNPMIVLEDETTRHLIPGSDGPDYDHDMDEAHVARVPDEDERYPGDGWRRAKPGEVPEQGNVRRDYCKLMVAGSMSESRPGMVDFRWIACIKHTNCEIETCELKEEDIRELLGVLA